MTALLLVLALGIAAWLLRNPSAPPPPPAAVDAHFVGSERCMVCHEQAAVAWSGSQHARAMQHATAATVRGDFGGTRFSWDGVTSSFFRRDDRFFVRTDGPEGRLADFEVKYTFGSEPLQQYLVELPGGRLQALALSWDTRPKEAGGQRWFRQYPGEKIDFRDELHWTKRSQNWNFMCADCHSSQVEKGYDAANDAYDTRFREVAVGCESCHGPGSAHLAWAATRAADATKGLTVALDERRGVGWAIDAVTGRAKRSRARTSDREIEVCAPCHARRAQIAEDYRAGAPLLDHYLPALLAPGLYHADGQQRDEVFVWGSWLQSRMHRQGVTCSDCHDPHTQKLRSEGNAVCAPCHAAGKYDAPSHHRHVAGTPGAQCANCHMPQATYMVVDPRRDHSLRVPRPDLSVELGVPNSCNQCHVKRDAIWAAAAVRSWLGRDAVGFQAFAPAFHAADAGRTSAAASLVALADDIGQSPIARAAAIERLALLGAADAKTAQQAARDAQPLVRLAAVRLAETLPAPQRSRVLAPLLADPRRAIRIEAARALAGLQDSLDSQQGAAWAHASEEYLATLRYTADRPEARVALGSFYARLGRYDEAQSAFAEARALEADHVPAYLNAADALRAQQRDAEAQQMLERGLARLPGNAALRHALGLTLVRRGQGKEALRELERAAQLAPGEPRYAYVHAVALHSSGRSADALRALERVAARWPDHRDVLFALATMQRDAGQIDAARSTAERLALGHPGDPEVAALARQLR
jgi:predicted CXXCH cytochrome family protein